MSTDSLEVHALQRRRQFDLFARADAAVLYRQPEGLVERSPVGLLDASKELGEITQRTEGLEHLFEREWCRRAGEQWPRRTRPQISPVG